MEDFEKQKILLVETRSFIVDYLVDNVRSAASTPAITIEKPTEVRGADTGLAINHLSIKPARFFKYREYHMISRFLLVGMIENKKGKPTERNFLKA